MRDWIYRFAVIIVLMLLLCIWVLTSRGIGRGVTSGFTAPILTGWQLFVRRARALTPWLDGSTAGTGVTREELLTQLREAELALAQAAGLHEQLSQLREFHQMRPPPGWHIVPAHILARDPLTWNRGFRINRGLRHGVRLGDGVLSGDRIIGRITECQEASSSVTTVAGGACRLSVTIEGHGLTGLLSGGSAASWRGKPTCTIHFLPRDVKVRVGELVWTSGLGDSIPGGLVVGRIADADGVPKISVSDSAQSSVEVEPLAEFDAIRYVGVICEDRGSVGP